jgi:hypothetical protein
MAELVIIMTSFSSSLICLSLDSSYNLKLPAAYFSSLISTFYASTKLFNLWI